MTQHDVCTTSSGQGWSHAYVNQHLCELLKAFLGFPMYVLLRKLWELEVIARIHRAIICLTCSRIAIMIFNTIEMNTLVICVHTTLNCLSESFHLSCKKHKLVLITYTCHNIKSQTYTRVSVYQCCISNSTMPSLLSL